MVRVSNILAMEQYLIEMVETSSISGYGSGFLRSWNGAITSLKYLRQVPFPAMGTVSYILPHRNLGDKFHIRLRIRFLAVCIVVTDIHNLAGYARTHVTLNNENSR